MTPTAQQSFTRDHKHLSTAPLDSRVEFSRGVRAEPRAALHTRSALRRSPFTPNGPQNLCVHACDRD
jgi:hypothetical protein